MNFIEDPRIRVARKNLILAWTFFFLYLAAIMLTSYFLGIDPTLWGLPRWVAIGNIIIPVIFVILLIFVVEALIPDISLTDDSEEEKNQ